MKAPETDPGMECPIFSRRLRVARSAFSWCQDGSSAPSFGPGFTDASPSDQIVRTVLFSGRDAVLTQIAALDKLAQSSRQHGAALGLGYVLEEEYAARKTPHLVCFLAGEELVGAVLLFEYRIWRLKTGLIATGDSFGVRTVFGAVGLREEIAVAACEALLDRGARVVLVSFKSDEDFRDRVFAPRGNQVDLWAWAAREVQDSMILGDSLEETLGSLGKRTRTRLREARKRFDIAVPGAFVRDAIGRLPLGEDGFLEQLNEESLDWIPQSMFNLQLRATERLPGGFLCGLHSAESGWLALLGGWRQGETTWVEWQVNRKGFERLSLGSVLRSYLLEEEVARGTRRLGFHGSTSHSMVHRFVRERVVDLLARRRSMIASLVVGLVPLLFRCVPALKRRGNFLADALIQPGLAWTQKVW